MKNPYSGKFIVVEGIDGAGGETQSSLLYNFFKKEKIPAEKLTYPDSKRPIGRLIHEFLHEKYEFSPESQFLLYLADFLKDKEKILRWLKRGKIVISDRYFTSTLAYQCQGAFLREKALKIAKLLELPRPDLVIYLKVSPQTSIKRKFKEKRNLDRFERNRKLLSQVAKFYEKTLIKKSIFSKWIIVDGEKAIKEVSEEINLFFPLRYRSGFRRN